MLKRVGGEINPEGAVITIGEADFPVPFPLGLEFNSPAHGNWNIVHTGMLMPEAIQIYVCADNCMRGVVLTAAEMNAADRFSFVTVEEENLLNGNLEDVTIEGVTDVLNKLEKKPKAVLLFTVCLHHFLGCDLDRVYEELGTRFPEIVFVRCFMDPIMQKHGLTPDQKLRKAMYDPLITKEPDPLTVTLVGSDFVLDESSDIKRLLRSTGHTLRELPACKTWAEYQQLGSAEIFVSCYPPAKYGAAMLTERLNRTHLYLPGCFDYGEIKEEIRNLIKELQAGWSREDTSNTKCADITSEEIEAFCQREITLCEDSINHAKSIIGDTPVVLDYLYHPRPLGLAKLLLEHGFHVTTVYLDSISPEEKPAFDWLKLHHPDLELRATIQTKMRVLPRGTEGKVLAIGQKAAWFSGSRNFVNMVQGGGLWGFDGIRGTMELMTEAFLEEKDPEDLIVRKGWGCESCI
ncbi:nitrogenase component 1 [Blautia obeum]|uniref:nitrogenase component 1 n=1 Tax=Blautia obeum TaxID=40520 RepID=UPI00156E6C29|nr:nitrogenase component 1 [Blautia obeum]NSG20470.1 nitrogenase [Blautia obeum]